MQFNLLHDAFSEIYNILKFEHDIDNIKSRCNEIIIKKLLTMNISGYISNDSIYPIIFLDKSVNN